MKVAIITPIYNPEYADWLSHFYMVLAHIAKKDPQYKNYWCNIKNKYWDSYVLLDNGCNENSLVTDLELLGLAAELKVDEIVAPDVFGSGVDTIHKTYTFLDTHYEKYIRDNFQVMAVLQGKNRGDFMMSYKVFMEEPRINTIGVGYRNLYEPFIDDMNKLTGDDWQKLIKVPYNHDVLQFNVDQKTFYYTLSRLYFMRRTNIFKDAFNNNKLIHLLGLTNPFELYILNKALTPVEKALIRGLDSASPIQAAQAGIVFEPRYGVKTKPQAMLEFDKRLTEEQKILVEKNINIMKEWLK